MFIKKAHVDVKKLTSKIQDSKKDTASRLRHLRTILDHVEIDEAKSIFETNYSHVYFILYDTFVQAETNLRQRVHKAHREELDGSLWLLEKILSLLPELIARRWQCHSLGRVMAKLLHHGNSSKLRREGVRYFLLWYQALCENAPPHVHAMFTELIPGLFVPQKGQIGLAETEFTAMDLMNHPNMKGEMGTSVFHDTGVHPVRPPEATPLLPPASNERTAAPDPRDGLEVFLDGMLKATAGLRWRDNTPQRHMKSFAFLLHRFKEVYLPLICPNFDYFTSIYDPKLDLPVMRTTSKREEVMTSCVVVLVNWISMFTREKISNNRLFMNIENDINDQANFMSNIKFVGFMQPHLIRDVLYSTRDNVNFVHEVYRQAFLLNYTTKPQISAIRTAIATYKEWMSGTPPPFLLEPDESCGSTNNGSELMPPRNQRLRTDSYLGAITKENLLIRAGLQNVLQVFVTNTANVFMIQTAHSNIVLQSKSRETTPLDEQTEVCKSVLNIYRTMVMNTKMDSKTWEQLLLVLLQITAVILSQVPPNSKRNNLGGRLAQPVFQTLIVTWIRAHTNVPVNPSLWSKFLNVLSSLTHREELIIEWNKTMQTLTRVMARQVYNLNLQDLPLDRLAEQKGKRRRAGANQQQVSGSREGSNSSNAIKPDANEELSINERQRPISGPSPLNRSYSEGSLAPFRKNRSRRRLKSTSKVPALPTNVEHSLNRILLNVPTNLSVSSETLNVTKTSQISIENNPLRKAMSLDSVRFRQGSESPRGSRSPSPTASNGIENGSIKDTALQIDMLAGDSSSIDTQDENNLASADRRSILLGGTARGWLPDVASVMWKRMLGALGDVNKILNPKLHALVFKHLVDITDSLIKIRMNQGISSDNQSTPQPPNLVPPIGIFSPWCYGALSLDFQYRDGKLWALQLLCSTVKHGPPLNNDQLPLFYHALHQALTGEDRAMAYTVLKYLGGPRFLSLLLPGHTLLLLDLVHASTVILTSTETNNVPRSEVTGLLSSLLCFPKSSLPKQFLTPSEPHVAVMDCADIQEHVLNVILRCARREPTSKARCIAISALAHWILQNLANPQYAQKGFIQNVAHKGQKYSVTRAAHNPRIKEAMQVILQALQFKHRTIARVAAEALRLIADKGKQLAEIERLPQLVIKSICIALEIQNIPHPKDADKNVLSSLLLCLGEFSMSIPIPLLMQTINNDPHENLVLIMLRILHQIGTGTETDRIKLFTPDEDFDMTILVDDIKTPNSTEASFQTAETTQNCINAIRLCAKTVLMHLVTNLGHFPMGIGASRLSSIVDEHDDISLLQQNDSTMSSTRDSVDFATQVLNASNLQMFLLNPGLVSSFVELPALRLPGGGITAGLVTADKQVRVLLRDLNGKACWDACILYREPKIQITNIDNIDEKPNAQSANQEGRYFTDKSQMNKPYHPSGRNFMVGASLDPLTSTVGLPLNPRQHTLRHRPPNQLPLANDIAADMDQLDDLLQYIGYTSPECLEESCTQLNAAAPSPLSSQLEAQTISIILNQRTLEYEFNAMQSSQCINLPTRLSKEDYYSKIRSGNELSRSTNNSLMRNELPFHYCKLLFSQLGLAGWERRKRTHLLIRTEKLLRELRNLDTQRCRETHKVAVIYVASGQEDKNSIFRNSCGSSTYEMFVSALGWEVELESHNGFLGGLPRQGCGLTSPYYATPFLEIIYHVATRMPYDSSEAILNKTRHLGNDEVHIVWSEHYRDYRRDILPTEFCDVLIVIYPLKSGLFRVTVTRKPEVPWFGPLTDESIVGGACLANLVRATAINASRAKRTSLPFYQQFYEERKRSLDTISSRHKESNTFEDFTARIYNPLPSGNIITTSTNSSLASAMIDNTYRNNSRKWSQQPTDMKSGIRDIPHQTLNAVNIDHPSPRAHRKLHPFKSAPKKHSQGSTPPDSPTLPGTTGRKFK